MAGEPAPKVLLVDDDPALIRMVRLSFLSEGFDVLTANDGLQALKVLDSDEVDVIVLDLLMPRMDGRTFHRALRARGSDTPVVVVSAYGADDAAIELHADAVLNKPFDPDVLIRVVRKLIRPRPTSQSNGERGRTACCA